MSSTTPVQNLEKPTFYGRYLLLIAGLGGLLYGIDVGIISGALPHLDATSGYTQAQLSMVVAAVLLGTVLSSLFAGALADLFGRKSIMIVSALLFVASIPIICLSSSIGMLVAGRLLQGISGGLIGVVIPLYLAECLSAKTRGKGTGLFQLLLTVGIVAAAILGRYYASHVESVENMPGSTPELIFAARDSAWRNIFWASIIPGIAFFAGAFFVTESPRWLFRRNKKDAALRALMKGNGEQAGRATFAEMEQAEAQAKTVSSVQKVKDSLLRRKYVIPFLIAVVILACNQATGINSVLGYAVNIFNQGGLVGRIGNDADVLLKAVNCIMTVVAVALVDRKGRKFLLKVGTGGIIIALVCAGFLFRHIETSRENVTSAVVPMVDKAGNTLVIDLASPATREALKPGLGGDTQILVSYSYGNYKNVAFVSTAFKDKVLRVAPPKPKDLEDSVIGAFFRKLHLNPFAKAIGADTAPLVITKASYGAQPSATTGWLVAACFIVFIAAFASGPGVCVWLALSELMPTRIRSNGMSIALLINQFVSATIAAIFLPVVGAVGYSTMFFVWAGFTVIYFCTAAFVMPETKGRTLEEIEEHFEGKRKLS